MQSHQTRKSWKEREARVDQNKFEREETSFNVFILCSIEYLVSKMLNDLGKREDKPCITLTLPWQSLIHWIGISLVKINPFAILPTFALSGF